VTKKSLKNLIMLVLSVSLVIGVVFAGGCVGQETEAPPQEPPTQITQIIEDITPQEAFTLIQENQDNPDFVIIDVQTPEKFAEERIEDAVNINYHPETFHDELSTLDRDKTYLIYCASGIRSGSALDMMAEFDFREVYKISGGIYAWKAEELPIVYIIEDITPQEAFTLIQEKQDNPDFFIIDMRNPEEFTDGHIENAINLDYRSETFQDELDKLDKNKIYLIYCASGIQSGSALDMMAELAFREVYKISGGINAWKAEELPTIQETPAQIIESITPEEAFTLIQENQDNPDFVIIDVQTPEEFVNRHIENAINIDYRSETFRDELNQLDKNKTYLIYYDCACGGIDRKALNMMAELNFSEVYKISGGLDRWEAEGFPTVE